VPEEVLEKIKTRQTADHRMGVPEDILQCFVDFLASVESRWINDANVVTSEWGKFASAPGLKKGLFPSISAIQIFPSVSNGRLALRYSII
jgi:hypothetical protein